MFTNESFTNGQMRRCTFATVATKANRLTFRNTTDAEVDDWIGSYQAFFLGYQIGGVAGDVEVQLTYEFNGSGDVTQLGFVPLRRVETDANGETVEVVNLGRIDIPSLARGLSEDHTVNLTRMDLNISAGLASHSDVLQRASVLVN